MINSLIKFKGGGNEKSYLMLLVTILIISIIDSSIIAYSQDEFASIWEDRNSEEEWDITYSQISESNTYSEALSDGESVILTEQISENWTADGWMVKSILVFVDYDETTFGDADCDTVTAILSFTGTTGESPVDSVTESSSTDCSQFVLSVEWRDPPTTYLASKDAIDTISDSFELEEAPLTVELDVRLNTDSTVPGNDDEEQISVQIQFEMIQIYSIE